MHQVGAEFFQTLFGKSVVEKLSKDLKQEFLNAKGFSVQNLWYMRQFYLKYSKNKILQQLVGELPWGHNLVILNKIKDIKETIHPYFPTTLID